MGAGERSPGRAGALFGPSHHQWRYSSPHHRSRVMPTIITARTSARAGMHSEEGWRGHGLFTTGAPVSHCQTITVEAPIALRTPFNTRSINGCQGWGTAGLSQWHPPTTQLG